MSFPEAGPRRTVLVIGANGFLGGHVAAALRRAGFGVVLGVRVSGRAPAADERPIDLATMTRPEDWVPVLAGVDIVVNAAGILREAGPQTFDALHVRGPLALAEACVACGVRRFVQVSALGAPEDGAFIASKHAFDDALLALPLDAVVLRPSIVYAAAGSYGGTSLLRALAAFPGAQWLPGRGEWAIQPVAMDDLAELVVAAAGNTVRGVFEVGGPVPMRLADYQATWRRWLRIPGTREVHVPGGLVSAQVWLWERLGRGPVGETMWRMLRRGNVTQPDAHAHVRDAFGVAPRALDVVLAGAASQVQDRWQAQLYFLAPTLRASIIALWVLSGIAGLRATDAQLHAMASGSWLGDAVSLARASAWLDLILAAWLAIGWRPRLALGLMGLSVLAYTLVFGIALPALWLEPLGGLAKNLVVLPALAVAWVLADRR
ncbi:oxidoreductase [Lysobacter helvus]|uniref:Oxidoreductase n=2 Tax=Lysobacteraceae TaxID=32033 RepID=A0ABM7Q487_9GAMM|nr:MULTISPECIES: SDR family oxidoreductase [Lysobacter]BCT92092.1 oxidoreductase [Lysobacter caseinilyticus]BCT95245.1 oxidoreductase [Lysobacter helvus]